MVKGFNKFQIELTTKATYNCEMHVAFLFIFVYYYVLEIYEIKSVYIRYQCDNYNLEKEENDITQLEI